MEWQKIDAGLSGALAEVKDKNVRALRVFIHTIDILSSSELDFLISKKVNNVSAKRTIFTAVLSQNDIEDLSDQPWIKYLRLSQKLELKNDKCY